VLEICLKEYFLKRKTLPTPLFRFFDLQKSIKEKKQLQLHNGDHDGSKNKDKDKDRDKDKDTVKRRKIKDLEKPKDEEKEVGADIITIIEDEITYLPDVEKQVEKAVEKEVLKGVDNQTKNTEGVKEVDDIIRNQEAENKIGELILDGDGGADRDREEGPVVPLGPKTPSPIFLSDPAYALIDRDFCVSDLITLRSSSLLWMSCLHLSVSQSVSLSL
jgi:hypothetical protein